MPMRFEVGKSYGASDPCFDPITVLKRTDKMILVTNGQSKWRMRLRTDADGNEYVTDSSWPNPHRLAYSTKWLTDKEG